LDSLPGDNRGTKTGSRSPWFQGVMIFLGFSLFGLAAIFVMADGAEETLTILAQLDWRYVALFLAMTVAGYFLGGARTWFIATPALQKQVSYWGCFKAELGNRFIGQVTPMQSGAGPAQLYLLHRAGLQLGEAMAVSLINFSCSMLVIFIFAGAIALSGVGVVTDGVLGYLLQFSFLCLAGICAIVLFITLRPGMVSTLSTGIRRIIEWVRPGSGAFWDALLVRLRRHLRQLWEHVTHFWKRRPWYVVGGVVATILVYGNKFALAYFIVRSLGVAVEFWDVISAMVILQAILYFSPSPGASGIAEIAAGSLMSYVLPTAHLLAFTIMWRFCNSYLGILVGGAVLNREIKASIADLIQLKGRVARS
jgi:glycosyltransferase 2 family protein